MLARAVRAGLEERVRVATAVVPVEPDRGGALPDELEVEVRRASEEVAKEAAVAVDVVESRIAARRAPSSRAEQPAQQSARLSAVALAALHLGRVDLDESHVLAVRQHDRVTVDHVLDADERPRCGRRRGRQHEQESDQDESEPHEPSVVGSPGSMRLEHSSTSTCATRGSTSSCGRTAVSTASGTPRARVVRPGRAWKAVGPVLEQPAGAWRRRPARRPGRRDRHRRRRPDRLLAQRASAARTRTAAASASPSR